jgi:hypothetical protein
MECLIHVSGKESRRGGEEERLTTIEFGLLNWCLFLFVSFQLVIFSQLFVLLSIVFLQMEPTGGVGRAKRRREKEEREIYIGNGKEEDEEREGEGDGEWKEGKEEGDAAERTTKYRKMENGRSFHEEGKAGFSELGQVGGERPSHAGSLMNLSEDERRNLVGNRKAVREVQRRLQGSAFHADDLEIGGFAEEDDIGDTRVFGEERGREGREGRGESVMDRMDKDDSDIPIIPFNLEEERESGYFVSDYQVQREGDAWLQELDEEDEAVQSGERLKRKHVGASSVEVLSRQEEDFVPPPALVSVLEWMGSIMETMGEETTVRSALSKLANKKAASFNSEKFSKFSESVDTCMFLKFHDIFNATVPSLKTKISFLKKEKPRTIGRSPLEHASSPVKSLPSRFVWELRWDEDSKSAVYGPFPPQQMVQWETEGYFGNAWVRRIATSGEGSPAPFVQAKRVNEWGK